MSDIFFLELFSYLYTQKNAVFVLIFKALKQASKLENISEILLNLVL